MIRIQQTDDDGWVIEVRGKPHEAEVGDPNRWEVRPMRRLWVGHPAIARWLARNLNRLRIWWER